MIIQKYGGTSVGTLERIQAVADIIVATQQKGNHVVVVVSAMSGETDRLETLAKTLKGEHAPREMDALLSTGEQVTTALLSMALISKGHQAQSFTGWQAKIKTNSHYNKARIERIDIDAISNCVEQGTIPVVAGFQGVGDSESITTLGRGGSDTTAVALAAALEADECQIYTDVDGVYTADPQIVSNARKLDRITYEEMLEMASLGSKVLQIRSVEFASKYNVRVRVLSSFSEGKGTIIGNEISNTIMMENALISGIAHSRDESKVTILGVPDRPGIASCILKPVADAQIEVDMIVQNVGENNTTDFTFTVHRKDYAKVCAILQEKLESLGARKLSGDDRVVKISVVGAGMRSHAGIASKMFQALASEGINIMMISTSEIKISVVIAEKYLELGVRKLHSTFGLDDRSAQQAI